MGLHDFSAKLSNFSTPGWEAGKIEQYLGIIGNKIAFN
jgi:hypothetical protein